MATKAIIGKRELEATNHLAATMQTLSATLGVAPVSVQVHGKHPDWVQMRRMEILADWAGQLVEPIRALVATDFQAEVDAVREGLQTELDQIYQKLETVWTALDALLYEKTKAELVALGADYGLDLDANDLKSTLVDTLLVELTGQQEAVVEAAATDGDPEPEQLPADPLVEGPIPEDDPADADALPATPDAESAQGDAVAAASDAPSEDAD